MKLAELQRRFATDLMKPLGRGDRVANVKASYIKRNDRLTSAERLEIYRRSYWYRLIDSMHEDFPGLRAVLGARLFDRLVRAYLTDCPSRSYTLRDLGSRLEAWLRRHRRLAGNKAAVAVDMAALEWAHIEAWDAAEEKALGPEDLIELGPKLRIGLQPHIRLLDLSYPVDDLRIQANPVEHEAASNTPVKPRARQAPRAARLKPGRIFVAVHRMDESIYYSRLTRDQFLVLRALGEHNTLGKALDACRTIPAARLAAGAREWFATWAELGWLCRA